MLRNSCVAAVLIAALAASPVSAQCWTGKEVSAARVRDLQTALMVGALQCRGSGTEVLPAFNRFVIAARAHIGRQNDLLRAHFAAESGPREGQVAYDRFTTSLANGHAQTTGASSYCATMVAYAEQAGEAAAGPDPVAALTALASELGERPRGVGDTCKLEIASR